MKRSSLVHFVLGWVSAPPTGVMAGSARGNLSAVGRCELLAHARVCAAWERSSIASWQKTGNHPPTVAVLAAGRTAGLYWVSWFRTSSCGRYRDGRPTDSSGG